MANRRRKRERAQQQQANNRPSPVNGQVPPAEFRWQPGTSGNPAGRVPGHNLKTLLRRALDTELDGLTVGEHVMARLVSAALQGDLKAIQQILDQVEGRPRPATPDQPAVTDTPKRILIPGSDAD